MVSSKPEFSVAVVGVLHMGHRASIALAARGVRRSSRLTMLICEVTETSAQCSMPKYYRLVFPIPDRPVVASVASKGGALHDSHNV